MYFKGIDSKSGKSFLEQNLNLCSLTKQPGLNIFVRLLYEQMKENINFKVECPFKTVGFKSLLQK